MVAIIKLNESGIQELINSPQEPVGKYMRDLGDQVATIARRLVRKRSRALERSIFSSATPGTGGVTITVGSQLRYALMVHNGTRPHLILPKHHRYLRFTSHGKVVYARVVHHPGTAPNPYLTLALREAVK